MSEPVDPLSFERIQEARETLTAAFRVTLRDGFPGARQGDPAGAFVEAKRNLAALVQWRFGDEAFERVMEADG